MLDHVFKFMAKVLEKTLHRPSRCITKSTNRMPFNLVGDTHKTVDIFKLALAIDNAI